MKVQKIGRTLLVYKAIASYINLPLHILPQDRGAGDEGHDMHGIFFTTPREYMLPSLTIKQRFLSRIHQIFV
jgi:hypothetical protein